VAVNKLDTAERDNLAHEFHALGIADVFPVSSEHGIGIDALLDHVTAGFPEASAGGRAGRTGYQGRHHRAPQRGQIDAAERADRPGARPSFRPSAGTTRDAVDEKVTRDGTDYLFVDTRGHPPAKSKTLLMAEKMSVVMARRPHPHGARGVAGAGFDRVASCGCSDSTIAGYAHEGGRALIICVNKWDQMKGRRARRSASSKTAVRDQFKFLDYAPIVFLSALTGAGVAPLFRLNPRGLRVGFAAHLHRRIEPLPEHLHFEERKIFYNHPALHPPRPRSRCSPIAAARCTSRTSATWSTSSGADSVFRGHPHPRSRREPRPKPRRGNGSAGGGAPRCGSLPPVGLCGPGKTPADKGVPSGPGATGCVCLFPAPRL